MPVSSSALSPTQCFLNAIVQCLSHTRGLRDYCLLKRYTQEKFANEDAKLTEGTVVVPALLLHLLPHRFSLCLYPFFHSSSSDPLLPTLCGSLCSCTSFLSGADRPLGWKWGGICHKSTSALQCFQRSGAILQWLQVRGALQRTAHYCSIILCN